MVSCRVRYVKDIYLGNGGFSVCLYENIDTGLEIVCKGIDLPRARKATFLFTGKWAPYKGGQTLEVAGQPDISECHGKDAIINTIANIRISLGDAQKPVGKRLAKKIYAIYADKSIEKLDDDSLKVCLVSFKTAANGEALAKAFDEAWRLYRKLQETVKILAAYGVSRAKIFTIQDKLKREHKPDLDEAVSGNPYFLIDYGVPLETCDLIAQFFGISPNSDMRIAGVVKSVLYKSAKEGHVFLYDKDTLYGQGLSSFHDDDRHIKKGVISQAAEIARVDGRRINEALLAEKKSFFIDRGKGGLCRVYLSRMYRYETGVADMISAIIKPTPTVIASDMAIESFFCDYEKRENILLAVKQKDAVRMVASSNISIITGIPGTGKTTILRVIAELVKATGKEGEIVLLAPTGKAARRMSKAIGMDAFTIHSRIGLEEESDNGGNCVDAKLLVIDEASMCDIRVMYALLSSLGNVERIVLVGDTEQLPSVYAGRVLDDLIASNRIPVTRLDAIQRQKEGSLIIENAQRILRGDHNLSFDNRTFRFIETFSAKAAEEKILALYTNTVLKQATLQEKQAAMDSIQILIPMKPRDCGAEIVNTRISEKLYPDSSKKISRFRVGDKVVNTKNSRSEDVNNGDMGYVTSIDGDECAVRFETGVEKVFVGQDIDNLLLAYGITIHRSQGDEFETVVIPLLEEQSFMLNRNLIYTAVTRAKKNVVLVGSRKALEISVKTVNANGRNSALGKRIEYGPYIASQNHC